MNNNSKSSYSQQGNNAKSKKQSDLDFEIPLEYNVPETNSDRAEAILALMRVAGIDAKNLLTIEAAIAEAANREYEFEASFSMLGARLLSKVEAFQKDAEEWKRIKDNLRQRWRRALERLEREQVATGFWFVKCERGFYDSNGEAKPSMITVNLSAISDVIQIANFRFDASKSRKFFFEEAARHVISYAKKETVERLPPVKMSDDKKLQRLEKTFINAAFKSGRLAAKTYDSETLQEFWQKLIQNAELQFLNGINEEFNDAPSVTFDTSESEESDAHPGVTFDTSESDVESEIVPSYVPVEGTQNAPSCVPPERQEEHTGQPIEVALQTLDVLEAAGVERAQVLITKDYDDRESDVLDCPWLPLAEIRQRMPQLLEKTREAHHSLILRPKTHSLLQIDDVTADVLPLLERFGIFTIETSPNNFQVWLQFEDKEAKESVRGRLFEKLKPTGANNGSNGAFRVSGSVNGKPKRNGFIVRLHSTDAGRETSFGELEAAGLLAPLPKPKPEQKRTGIYVNAKRKFPDYGKCLASKNNDRSEADASFVRICLERGFSESEIEAALLEVSERAREKNRSGHYKDYYQRTFEFCSRGL